MRSLLSLLAVTLAPLWALGQELPRPAFVFERFVFLPFAAAFDEVLLADVKAGKYKPADMPAQLRRMPAATGENAPAVEPWLEIQDFRTKAWRKADDDECRRIVTGMFFFPRWVCHYDGEGNYYLHGTVFDAYKGRLVTDHDGRIEHFLTAAVAKRQALNPKEGFGSDNHMDHQSFVWDATDKTWRDPFTLTRVEKGRKLSDGSKLWDHKPLNEVTDAAKLGKVGDIALRFDKKYWADRATRQKEIAARPKSAVANPEADD